MTKFTLLFFMILAISVVNGQELVDITNLGGTISAQYMDSPAGEDITKVIDNSSTTKYLTFHSSGWIQFQALGLYIVSEYSITSANDAETRDPRNWTLKASNDGTNWTTLDSRTNQDFPSRFQTRKFTFTNPEPDTGFMFYRLGMTNNSGDILQLAEWELFGSVAGDTSTTVPMAPSDLAATSMSYKEVKLDWTDNSDNETLFRIEVSKDGLHWTQNGLALKNSTTFTVDNLMPSTFYSFRVYAENSIGFSDFSNTSTATTREYIPPETWREHWFEHNQLVKRVYYDDDVAIYFDDDMNKSYTWMNKLCGDVWRYCIEQYGEMWDSTAVDHRLYAIFHQNKYGGGHPAYYYDGSHDYRNCIDIGQNGSWASATGWNLDATVHEIGHIIESTPFGLKKSPAFGLWRDSKWMEIFQYDVYKSMGWTSEANRWYNEKMNTVDDFPRAGTRWFRNWFYPIYNKYGGAACLVKFFRLLGENIPDRDMNWGEFVHFWSGAAGVNLKDQATTAFGWSSTYENQLLKARNNFPDITYKMTAVELADAPVVTEFQLAQNYPNPFNSETVFEYTLPQSDQTLLVIYNVQGQIVRILVDELQFEGQHQIKWDGRDSNGEVVPSGLYIYYLESDDLSLSNKLMFLK